MPGARTWLLLTLAVVTGISLWVRITDVDREEIRQQAESIAAESAEAAARLAARGSEEVEAAAGALDSASTEGFARDTAHEHSDADSGSGSGPGPDTAAGSDHGNNDQAASDAGADAGVGGQAVLSARVYDVINEVQQRFMAQQWVEGLDDLNALYEDFEQLNALEQSTVLNFYTNALISLEMYDEAIIAFEEVLTLPDLRSNVESRATMALGQLYARDGNYAASAAYLSDWLALEGNSSADAPGADAVLLMLANAHLNMDNHGAAIAFLEDHIGVRMHMGQPVPRQSYELLRQLQAQTGNHEDATAVQRILDNLQD